MAYCKCSQHIEGVAALSRNRCPTVFLADNAAGYRGNFDAREK